MKIVVPHLKTANASPLYEIESHLLEKRHTIEAWFRQMWRETPPPFYASVDLRNAGFKLSPVDTNLFPAGFNNLSEEFVPLCIQAIQVAIDKVCPEARHLGLIPENHTRNLFYLENVAALKAIAEQAGYCVSVGSMSPEVGETTTFDLPSGKQLTMHPVVRDGDKVTIDGITPCSLLLNNDLSSGVPSLLEGLSQNIVPPLKLGWSHRFKSEHFGFYDNVAQTLAEMIGIDPWLINPYFSTCDQIDFKTREGEQCLAQEVELLLAKIQAKYDEYGIDQAPFIIVKADAGTYGMGIMTVRSSEDVMNLNKKQRNKMASQKEGLGVSQVILQEGVYTFETVEQGDEEAIAEPVVYMIDRYVVGGFYRLHTGRGVDENLNAPGANFEPMAFIDSCSRPDECVAPDAPPNRFYSYGVIARLALLAAALEIKAAKAQMNHEQAA